MKRYTAAPAKAMWFEIAVAGVALLILLITQWFLSSTIRGLNYYGLIISRESS